MSSVSGSRGRFLAGLLVVAVLSACKLFQKEEPAGLPDAEPTAAVPAEAAAEPTATATAEATATPTAQGGTPTTKPTVSLPKDAGAGDAAPAAQDAGAAPKDASAADASGAKSAACQTKCQAVLQACLTPGVSEAGLPTLADPTKCKTAFDECAAACK